MVLQLRRAARHLENRALSTLADAGLSREDFQALYPQQEYSEQAETVVRLTIFHGIFDTDPTSLWFGSHLPDDMSTKPHALRAGQATAAA